MIERKKVKIIYFFLCVFFINNISFGNSFPTLIIKPDRYIRTMLDSEPNFLKENPLEYKNQWRKIIKSLEKVYKEMWNDFNSKGNDILPWCVYEAVNDLKLKKSIEIYFSIRELNEFPTGRIPIYGGVLGEYFSVKMGNASLYEGIWIFGLWKKWYRETIDSSVRYCLKAVLFHEILHYALDITDRESNNTYFKVRNILNPRKTTINNFWSDEGVIEDCETRLFKDCSDEPYKYFKKEWYKNNARRYNGSPDDCVECKLCKKKKK